MSADVHQLPTGQFTDRLVRRALAAGAVQMAGPGDLVALCTDAEADVWTVFPVASVDSFGSVTAVQLQDHRTLGLWWAQDPRMRALFVQAVALFDQAGVAALRWTSHQGLAAVTDAFRPHYIGPRK